MATSTFGAQFQDNPGCGFPVAGAISQYLLVKLVASVLTLCAKDANSDWIGTTTEPRSASGQTVPVRFRSAGTHLGTTAASETINGGDVLYKQANGQVGKASTGSVAVGIAKGSATGAGQYIEFFPFH